MSEREEDITKDTQKKSFSETIAIARAEMEIEDVVKLIKNNNIAKKINFTKQEDLRLFTLYMTQRVLRTDIYDSSWLLSHPTIAAFLKFPGLNRLVKTLDHIDRNYREILNRVTEMTESFKKEHYSSPEELTLARTIELSANDLSAKSTVFNEKKSSTEIKITKDIVDSWSPRWKDLIEKLY